jgi:endogenous inhibitor of DNA gyrase (YacG/DUF329 family)
MAESPPCPSCGRAPADPRWRPFCSERCKLVDLGRWLSGAYRVPADPSETLPDEDGPQDPENDR